RCWPDTKGPCRNGELTSGPLESICAFCSQSRQRATAQSARQFMQQVEAQRRMGVLELATWKKGLNWFFGEAARAQVRVPEGEQKGARSQRGLQMKVPPPAATALGGTEWARR